jgi:hypothetical protein
MNDLMIAESKDLAAVFGCGGIDPLLEEIEAKARSFVADASTTKGRKEIASMAFAVARTKTALDEAGKNLVAERKKIIGLVDAERKMVRDRLDALRDEVRRPLDEWEQAEMDRASALEARLAKISGPPCGTSAHAAARIAWLESVEIDETWQERAADAAKVKDAAIREWKAYRIVTAASEQAAAEAEARAKAEAERVQREREERIAREAAERATREAEQRAAKEKAEAERRAIEAEQRAKQAEADAERKAQEAVAREAAERRRIAEEEEAARKRREDDEKHKLKIMESACKALLAIGLSQESALSVVLAISNGKVPHISISY